MQPHIYLDTLLLTNLLMNAVLLWAASSFAGYRVRPLRLLAGAGIGSVYAVTLLLPPAWSTAPVKILVSVVMVLAAFAPVRLGSFLLLLGFFYLSAFLVGGISLCLSYFMLNSRSFALWVGDQSVSSLGIATAAAIALVLGKACWGFVRTGVWRKLFVVPLEIELNGVKARLKGLVDTGNHLRDPISGLPVVVVQYDSVARLLPQPLRSAFRSENIEVSPLTSGVSGVASLTRLRVIPYRSLGKRDGMLWAFRPDGLTVYEGESPLKGGEALVAVYGNELSPDGAYEALIPPAILQTRQCIGRVGFHRRARLMGVREC